jgi:phosphatidylserine/phosphatidylglycerophosphate/cardiolipin synthase-like enzyme
VSAVTPRALSSVPRATLEQLSGAIERGRIECPLREIELLDEGLGPHAPALLDALATLDAPGALAVLRAVLAERTYRPPPRLDLVWSGPDARGTTSRDTSLVVRALFEGAEREVIVGGYSFDKPEILAPLHRAMVGRGVRATLFMDIGSTAKSAAQADEHAIAVIDRFFFRVWTFGAPRPAVFWDPRTARPGPPWQSLHAKCIVVDESRALVTSANFTDRGQERNIEVGVLIDDRAFASELAAQWRALITAGALSRYHSAPAGK